MQNLTQPRSESRPSNPSRRAWRCKRCRLLLGVQRPDGRWHLKWKAAEYVAHGPVEAVCRRCGEVNRSDEATGR